MQLFTINLTPVNYTETQPSSSKGKKTGTPLCLVCGANTIVLNPKGQTDLPSAMAKALNKAMLDSAKVLDLPISGQSQATVQTFVASRLTTGTAKGNITGTQVQTDQLNQMLFTNVRTFVVSSLTGKSFNSLNRKQRRAVNTIITGCVTTIVNRVNSGTVITGQTTRSTIQASAWERQLEQITEQQIPGAKQPNGHGLIPVGARD